MALSRFVKYVGAVGRARRVIVKHRTGAQRRSTALTSLLPAVL